MLAPTITADILPRLIDAARTGKSGARDLAVVCIAIDTGARPCELAGMTWRVVCDAAGNLTGRARWQTRKNGNVRDVPLSPETVAALTALRMVSGEPEGRAWLFPGPNGRMVDSSMRALLTAIARRGRLDASGYSLRHLTFTVKANAAVAAGATVADLARFTGHKGITTPAAYMEANTVARAAIDAARVMP